MITLNSRRVFIIREILKVKKPYCINNLSKKLNCSIGTVHYDLDVIDSWLREHSLPLLERRHGEGVYYHYNHSIKNQIITLLNQLHANNYHFNRSERVEVISLILLTSKKVYTISQLQNFFLVSKSTILVDLNKVEEKLYAYSIKLKRKPRKGLWVEGSEINIRQKLIHLNKTMQHQTIQVFINELSAKNKENNAQQFSPYLSGIINRLHIRKIQSLVEPILEGFGLYLSDESRETLYLHIGMVLQRIDGHKQMQFDGNFLKGVSDTKELQIAKIIIQQIETSFQVTLPQEELDYIALHLLSKQRAPHLTIDGKNLEEQLHQLILRLILQVEQLLGVKFKSKERLAKGLFIHLRPAIYRSKYGLNGENPLLKEVKKKYPRLFSSVDKSLEEIRSVYQISFNEEEIAYITMHFGSELLRIEDKSPKVVRIIIVCTSGIGTARLLESRLLASYSNIKIVDILSYNAFTEKENWDVDLIVSTIDIRHQNIPSIRVNPLLSKKDKEKLNLFFIQKTKDDVPFTSQMLYERIWPIINRYTHIHEPKLLTDKLLNEFDNILYDREYFSPNLLVDILNSEMIQLDKKASDWKEAINIAAKPLINSFFIDATYPKSIISIIQERGPYMAVAPGIMFAHAKTQKKNIMALSLTRFDPGINFGHDTNDPIKLLFMFVVSKDTKQPQILKELLEVLLEEKSREILFHGTSKKQIITTLSKRK